MAATAAELAAVEARLRADPRSVRGRLETATIYNIPTLRRAGAKAHDWFAFVKPASKHVGFYLLPMVTWPDLLDGCSPALLEAAAGEVGVHVRGVDEALFAELEALVARAYERYVAG